MAKHVIALAIFCPVMLIFSADFVASFSGAIYFVSIFYFCSRTVLGRKAVRKYYVEILKMEKQYLTPKNKSHV